MNEELIQNNLYRWCYRKGHIHIVPNVYIFDWESDFLSITRSLYSHEYEIKITKSDFKQDIRKRKKHEILSNGCYEPDKTENLFIKISRERETFSHPIIDRLTFDDKITGTRPNYFWYVCPFT